MSKINGICTNARMAAAMYINRRDRLTHPAGTFDKAGRWRPADDEAASCCDTIRNPSRRHALGLNAHCRTAVHIATLHGISAVDVLRAAKALEAELAVTA